MQAIPSTTRPMPRAATATSPCANKVMYSMHTVVHAVATHPHSHHPSTASTSRGKSLRAAVCGNLADPPSRCEGHSPTDYSPLDFCVVSRWDKLEHELVGSRPLVLHLLCAGQGSGRSIRSGPLPPSRHPRPLQAHCKPIVCRAGEQSLFRIYTAVLPDAYVSSRAARVEFGCWFLASSA